jgi:hypothetical protein
MDHPEPPRTPPEHWDDALAESRADLAAGRIVPASKIHTLLQQTLDAAAATAQTAREKDPAKAR